MAEITEVWSPLCSLRNAHLISGSPPVCSGHRVLLGLGSQGNPTSPEGCWTRPLANISWQNRHFVEAEEGTQKSSSWCPASWAASAHRCLTSSFSSTRTPQVLCRAILSDSSQSVPMPGTALSWTSWTSSPSWVSHGPTSQAGHKFLFTANLLRVHSVPQSTLAIKVLKSTGARDLWDTTHHWPPWTQSYWPPLHPFSHSSSTEQSTLPMHFSPVWS